MTKSRYFGSASAIVAILAFGTAAPALAQTAARPAPVPTATPHSVDELIVTAQKREQNLQDVPIVVTSVNAQQMRDAGIHDIKDLTIVAPGLTVTTTSSSAVTSARIRGVGTVGDNVGLESSVGVVIDGVYRPRNGVAFGDLGDLQRIEVLKGPQGTLFGKNTSAGVINVVTAQPSFTFGANGEATVSNYNGYGLTASVTGPIMADKLAGRLFVARRERDGFYKRVDGTTNDQNFYTARGQLLAKPTEDLDFLLAGDYTRRNERCCGAVQISNAAGPTAVLNSIVPNAILNPPDPSAYRDFGTFNDKKRTVDQGLALTGNWKTNMLGGATLTSITAGRQWEQKGGGDTDGTAVDILRTPGLKNADPASTRFKQLSQEFRLAGDTGKLNWLIGAFFTDEKLRQHTRLEYGSQFEQYANGLFGGTLPLFTGQPATGLTLRAGQGQNDTYNQHEKGQSIFTNDSYKITDALELTVGLRYTWESKELRSLWTNSDGSSGCTTALARAQALGGPIPASGSLVRAGGLLGTGPYSLLCGTFQNPRFDQIATNSQSINESKLTGTGKLAYRINPEVLTYVSYAHGYKAGGFNLDRIAQPTQTVANLAAAPVLDTRFAPETVNSYEVGIKNTLLDRTLLLNATVFYQEFKSFQLNSFNGLVFNVTSVPKVISRGIDTDLIWFTPITGLTVNGGVTYAETFYPRSDASVLGFPPATGIPAGAGAGNVRLPGSRLSLAPLWSVAGAATYEHPVTENLVGRVAVNAKYVSSFNTGSNLDPVKNQSGFTLVNARVAIGSADKRWQLEAYATNLFNKIYYQVGFDAVAQSGSYDAFLGLPRQYGLTLRVQY